LCGVKNNGANGYEKQGPPLAVIIGIRKKEPASKENDSKPQNAPVNDLAHNVPFF